jgi:hypothetical protein
MDDLVEDCVLAVDVIIVLEGLLLSLSACVYVCTYQLVDLWVGLLPRLVYHLILIVCLHAQELP